jgi:hypothetical protein
MKRIVVCLIFTVIGLYSQSQVITASKTANLEVYAVKLDGSQLVMTSNELSVNYDQLQMRGELDLNTLKTEDELLRNLLDSAIAERITFFGTLPEGKFVFHDSMNEQFTVETEVHYNNLQSRIVISYDVSNRKSSIANTFDITCMGSLSLSEDLGVIRQTGLEDKISFRFFQNVQTKSY